MEERSLVFDGLRQIVRMKNFILLMAIFFIGLGVFNSVTTWIEDILRPRGFSITQAGLTGGLMVIGGIAGAAILPVLSDRYHRRFLLSSWRWQLHDWSDRDHICSELPDLAIAALSWDFLLSAGPIDSIWHQRSPIQPLRALQMVFLDDGADLASSYPGHGQL
jgi:MFS family permease